MTVSTDIANELATRLRTIRTANGFITEAGQDVALGWRNLDETAVLPRLSIIETGHSISDEAVRGRNVSIQITWTVEGMAVQGVNALASLYDIEADVLKALFLTDIKIGTRYVRLAYQGREIAPFETGSNLAQIGIGFVTTHQEQLI